jgi:uncharacterized membrane protein YkoI
MPRPRLTFALLAVLTLAVGTAESANRTPGVQAEEGRIVLAAGGVSLSQAISMVERRYKARVVRSEERRDGERKIYVLRLLDDAGNAQVVRVDASNGAIL